jgi:hypothetical protein
LSPARKEAEMHAVVVRVSFDPSREEEAVAGLHGLVIPRVKEAPGVVAGYWWHENGGHGVGVVVFENEGAAEVGAQAAKEGPRPDFISFDGVEVHELVGNI